MLVVPRMERLRVSLDDGYGRWAPHYDAHAPVNPLVLVEQPIVRRLLGDLRGKRALDAGCGTGRHAVWMHEEGALVTGIEPNPTMLALARAKQSRIDWRQGELAPLGLGAAEFEVVVCALVLDHLEEIATPLAELHRALMPGGTLVISMYHPCFPMRGSPPHFAAASEPVEYELPWQAHLPSTYFTALRALGMDVTEMIEPLVESALIARLPRMEKHRGWPLALIMQARKAG